VPVAVGTIRGASIDRDKVEQFCLSRFFLVQNHTHRHKYNNIRICSRRSSGRKRMTKNKPLKEEKNYRPINDNITYSYYL